MADIFQSIDELEPDALQRVVDRLEFRGTYAPFVAMRDAYLDRIDLPPGARVCELGCGTGVVSRALASRPGFDGTVTATDASDALIAEARRRAEEAGIDNLAFATADAGGVAEPDDSFDLVVLHTLISHVPDPTAVIAEARRLVRPDGTIAVFDGDYASLTCHTGAPEEDARVVGAVLDAVVAQPLVMRALPGLMREQGLALADALGDVLLEAGLAEFFESLFAAYVPMAVRGGHLSAAEGDAWLGGFRRACDERRIFGSCNFIAYVARPA